MIQVRDLTKKFGDFAAVDGISFDVHKGEIFAFLGPNGAGKTTTIKMLTTLLRPSGGAIELDGLDPIAQQNEARARFGIVFQDPSTASSPPTKTWTSTGCSTRSRASSATSASRA